MLKSSLSTDDFLICHVLFQLLIFLKIKENKENVERE